jgi:hypothetical protein
MKKTSLKVRKMANCAPTISPNTTYIFGGSSYFRCSRRLFIKNTVVFMIP